jgi:hypothetical protein
MLGPGRVECEPLFGLLCAYEAQTQTRIMKTRKRFLTQRRKGAKEDAKKNLCAAAPLREKFFIRVTDFAKLASVFP